MLSLFRADARALVPAGDLPERGWAHLSAPSDAEIELLRARGVPETLVTHALDIDEVSRIDREDDVTLVVVRVPRRRDADPDLPYRSESLGILLSGGLVVTCSRSAETDLFDGVAALQGIDPARPLALVLRLVMYAAERFLTHVRSIDAIVNGLEGKLRASLSNAEVLDLLKYQKGLVHFTTALGSNRIMLERLAKDSHVTIGDDDRELLEDALVEVHQAIDMAGMSADILSQTMDAFASIISNNLNVVMKVLTSATLVLTAPMLIATLYGMNVGLPGQSHPLAFAGILLASSFVALAVSLWFWRRHWL